MFYVEQFFDRLLDLNLVSILRHLEAQRPLFFLFRDAFFGDEGPHQHVMDRHCPASFPGADFATQGRPIRAEAHPPPHFPATLQVTQRRVNIRKGTVNLICPAGLRRRTGVGNRVE